MKLDTPDFHDGDLFIRLYMGALSYLHLSEHMPERKQPAEGAGLFTFNTEGLTTEELVAAANKVVETRLEVSVEQAAVNGADPDDPTEWDSVFLHGASVLRHALIYTELRHAVKHGDPGRMKALFPYLIPIFKSTGKHKYAGELLEVMKRWKYVQQPCIFTY
jgi:hypothetical protein